SVWRSRPSCSTLSACHARVAERQTRCLQVAVSLWAWGFKSPLAHRWRPRPIGRGLRAAPPCMPAGRPCDACWSDVSTGSTVDEIVDNFVNSPETRANVPFEGGPGLKEEPNEPT